MGGYNTGTSEYTDNAAVLTRNRFVHANNGDESGTCPKLPDCNGSHDQHSCCTSTNKCGKGGGDCDSDNDCEAGLKCGTNNCKSFNPSADPTNDCCYDSKDCNGSYGEDYCRTSTNKCGKGGGDCDSDNDCEAGLKCGT